MRARGQRDRSARHQRRAVDGCDAQRVGIAAAVLVVGEYVAGRCAVLVDGIAVVARDWRWVADRERDRCRNNAAMSVGGIDENRVDAIVGRATLGGRRRWRTRERAGAGIERDARRQRAGRRKRERIAVVGIAEEPGDGQWRDRRAVKSCLCGDDMVGIDRGRAGMSRIDDDRRIVLAGDGDRYIGRGSAALAVAHLIAERVGRGCALAQAVERAMRVVAIRSVGGHDEVRPRRQRDDVACRVRRTVDLRHGKRVVVVAAIVVADAARIRIGNDVARCGAVLEHRVRVVDGNRGRV